MVYVSELRGKMITDVDGERIGRVEDLLASVREGARHPQIVALLVARPHGILLINIADVAVMVAQAIPLSLPFDEVIPYTPNANDLYLVRDVLNKQIIDTNGMRVVRVNDLELTRVEGRFYIANVCVGGMGLLGRFGLTKSVQKLSRLQLTSSMISWDHVELITSEQTLRLKVPREKIAELHPADLAEIVSDLSRNESSKLLESLDVKMAADVLEAVEPDFQASLVEGMPDEKVADLLEEMAPDEAADLLAELPEDRSQELLRLMEDEEEEEVRKLLSYPEDQAGGIMTTEFITVRPDLSVEQAIAYLRETAQSAETFIYVYVTDTENRLVGVLSLQDLVLAKPDKPIADIMQRRVVYVNLLDNQTRVAQLVAKYNLFAIPVVDNHHRLHGIVTADDALDQIIPTAWKRRIPRLYH
jgi:CBS domain-containing protein/sporulation protein YlmC with PRC-barrel domain